MLLKILNPYKLLKFFIEFIKNNISFIKNKYLNSKFYNLNYLIQNLFNFNEKTYSKYCNNVVAEHQIGRIVNMRDLVNKHKNEITGDFLELGVFEGWSLVFFDKLLDKQKKMIGIDTFEGLPHDSVKVSLGEKSVPVWVKGEFGSTSTLKVEKNLKKFNCREVSLLKGVFADKTIHEELKKLSNHISIVHIDCDLRDSAYDALELIKSYMQSKKSMFILFDDWGVHQNEIPDGFYKWVNENQPILKFNLEKLYTTNYTRYYKLSF